MRVVSRLLVASPEHRLMETLCTLIYTSISDNVSCQNLTGNIRKITKSVKHLFKCNTKSNLNNTLTHESNLNFEGNVIMIHIVYTVYRCNTVVMQSAGSYIYHLLFSEINTFSYDI